MWNNFSRCPALISLCGNSSLVPNCGARRTQPEHTAEQKGNNWSLPCPAHRFILLFIIMCFIEGEYLISFRHFMSAAPFLSLYIICPFFVLAFFPPFYTVIICEHSFYQATETTSSMLFKQWLKPAKTTCLLSLMLPSKNSCHILNWPLQWIIYTLVINWSWLLSCEPCLTVKEGQRLLWSHSFNPLLSSLSDGHVSSSMKQIKPCRKSDTETALEVW